MEQRALNDQPPSNFVAVVTKPTNQVTLYDASAFPDLHRGDAVIVETRFGPQIGWVKGKEVPSDGVKLGKRLIRRATQDDARTFFRFLEEARNDMEFVRKKVLAHNLPMHLLDAEYPLDKNQLVVYFTAEGRVDFRALVADLKVSFPRRVMLFQVGIRDAIRMIGALGPCGRIACCSLISQPFESVSLKMARDQLLDLNPSRLLGACGKLKCCLRHEYDFYQEMSLKLPRLGDTVQTSRGIGAVISVNYLTQRVSILLESGGSIVCTPSELTWSGTIECPHCPISSGPSLENLNTLEFGSR